MDRIIASDLSGEVCVGWAQIEVYPALQGSRPETLQGRGKRSRGADALTHGPIAETDKTKRIFPILLYSFNPVDYTEMVTHAWQI